MKQPLHEGYCGATCTYILNLNRSVLKIELDICILRFGWLDYETYRLNLAVGPKTVAFDASRRACRVQGYIFSPCTSFDSHQFELICIAPYCLSWVSVECEC